jgi:hypothetical protein
MPPFAWRIEDDIGAIRATQSCLADNLEDVVGHTCFS